MDVSIKSFDAKVEVKSKGIEFEVRGPNGGGHTGDCFITMTGIIWCEGKKKKENGVKITWDELRDVLATADTRKAAVKAARSV